MASNELKNEILDALLAALRTAADVDVIKDAIQGGSGDNLRDALLKGGDDTDSNFVERAETLLRNTQAAYDAANGLLP